MESQNNLDNIDSFVDDLEELEQSNQNSFNPSKEYGIANVLNIERKAFAKIKKWNKYTDICLKIGYAGFILYILWVWMSFVIDFSYQQLNPCDKCVHKVSDGVFIALLTTATANILVLPGIVLKYLFPNSNKK